MFNNINVFVYSKKITLNAKTLKYIVYFLIIIVVLFVLIILYSLLGYKEGLLNNITTNRSTTSSSTTCNQRSNCNTCLDGTKDSTGSVCYWCKNKGCVNPDDYYDPTTCSSDQKCLLVQSLVKV